MADTAWIGSPIHSVASDWAARVVVNGGAAPSDGTVRAISDFCGALDAAAISAKMIGLNVFAPDNLIAAITPLYKVLGNDPYTNNNFLSSDLSLLGLKGNGTSKSLQTNINARSAFTSPTSMGMSLYNTFPDNASNSFVDSKTYDSTTYFGLNASTLGSVTFFSCVPTGITAPALPFGLGFVSVSRTGVTATDFYAATSSIPFASIGSSAALIGGAVPTSIIPLFANYTGSISQWSIKRFSFAAIHLGLSSSETQSLYNAVQTLRVALGGGFV